MGGRHVALRPALLPPQGHQHRGEEMGIEACQASGIEADGAVGQPAGMAVEEISGRAIEGFRDQPRLMPEADKRCGGRRPGPRLETRQHLVPEERPGEARIGVGGILPPREPPIDEKPPQTGPAHPEQGTQKGHAIDQPPSRLHPRQSSHPRSAQRPVEDRLGLIVGRVRHKQMPRPTLVGDPSEPAIPEAPGAGLSFAIPIDLARDVAAEILQQGRASHPYIGVRLQSLSPELAREVNATNAECRLPETYGVVVVEVLRGSPAAKGGLRACDLIEAVANAAVKNPADVQLAVDQGEIGQPLSLKVRRGGQSLSLDLRPAELPNQN